ncbi:MAG: hypothetical protein LBK97_07480 [Prevotellaceae bacterium]|jgi:hypothetical protein|nr:hypothetical protein [Prevotellaceae bacterium]
MITFQINIFKGHPIIKDGENTILIDTGAPSTIHVANSLEFGADRYGCTVNYMGLTVQKISEMLGTEITTLIGADILSNYKVFLDYQNASAGFSRNETGSFGCETGISSFMGIPIIELTVDGKRLKFFLDTGAKLSYLASQLTANHKSAGIEDDFYPGIGCFKTECYEISTCIGDKEFMVKYGNLPSLLQMTLTLGGTNGIIGFDFFNHFKVCLDIKGRKLKYQQNTIR